MWLVLWLWFQGLAEKYKKTAAQISLRWGIQRNTVVIPKTSKLERLKENFQVFDFELSKEDMELISSMDRKYRTNQPAKFWGIDLYAWECPSFLNMYHGHPNMLENIMTFQLWVLYWHFDLAYAKLLGHPL